MVALPIAIAALLTVVQVDGRPFHHAARALVGLALGSRASSGLRRCEVVGTQWRHGPVIMLPDGSDTAFRRVRYRGPGAVLVAYPHLREQWARRGRSDLRVSRLGGAALGEPVLIELGRRSSLEVR